MEFSDITTHDAKGTYMDGRLTKWIDAGEERCAIPDPEIRTNGHNKCMNRLAEYEDTGFTPGEILEIKRIRENIRMIMM